MHIEYLVTASESRSGLMIDSKKRRFETEIKSGFCWIFQRIYVRFVLSYSITDDYQIMGRLKRTARPCLIPFCWIWTLKPGQSLFFLSKNVAISNLFSLLFIKSRSIIEIFTDRSVSRSIKIVNQFQMIFLAFNITFVHTIIGTNCLWTPCPARYTMKGNWKREIENLKMFDDDFLSTVGNADPKASKVTKNSFILNQFVSR